MSFDHALVLLSGLDSAAALHWAREKFQAVAAISFWYGQPHGSAEVAASQAIAARRAVPWEGLHIAEAVRGLMAIGPPIPGLEGGISRANLPARNSILLSVAAAHAARLWPGASAALVIGANTDDACGFPDCRPIFLEAASTALRLSSATARRIFSHGPPCAMALFDEWEPRLHASFPVAFVLQDGQDPAAIPWDRIECLFIGGSTSYKMGHEAEGIAREAKARGKLVHIGRVNSIRRMAYAHSVGADSIDGTSFSRFPDRWIPWALDAMVRIEKQVSLPFGETETINAHP